MSITVLVASELATIAAFARGCDHASRFCAMLSSANVAAYFAEYGDREQVVTAEAIDAAAVPKDATLNTAAERLAALASNCVTSRGTDFRHSATGYAHGLPHVMGALDAFHQLARAILAEQVLAGVRGPGFDRLRAQGIPGAPESPIMGRWMGEEAEAEETMPHAEAVERIRAALRRRSDRAWSVTTKRGTTHGWIRIVAPQARLNASSGHMSEEDTADLARLFHLDSVHGQGLDIHPHERRRYVRAVEKE